MQQVMSICVVIYTSAPYRFSGSVFNP